MPTYNGDNKNNTFTAANLTMALAFMLVITNKVRFLVASLVMPYLIT